MLLQPLLIRTLTQLNFQVVSLNMYLSPVFPIFLILKVLINLLQMHLSLIPVRFLTAEKPVVTILDPSYIFLSFAHHSVIASTGQSNAPGIAPETEDAEYDSLAIESDASLDYLLTRDIE